MPIHKLKHCKRCDTTKSSDQFYRRRKGKDLSPYCKICTKDQTLERQRALKIKAITYKGGKCQKCGYDKCPSALEFHHLEPSGKDFTISHAKQTAWGKKITDELDKCILLCANCHREVHWVEKQFTNLSPRVPKKDNHCSECKIKLQNSKAKRCILCQSKHREKINWPNAKTLRQMVEDSNYSAVGRKLGVSDNAVRKRLKNHT